MNTLPLRLTILHLAQRFRIDGETFMITILLANMAIAITNSQDYNYTRSSFFRPEFTGHPHQIIGQSGVEVLLR